MERYELDNGLMILARKKDSKLTAIHLTVKAGSIHEPEHLSGISHFIEHLAFDGTESRTAREIATEIEGIGGEISAYTSNEKTCFYIRALNNRIVLAIKVLFDIVANSTFSGEFIEKERKIIVSEISMRKDQPRSHQWEMLMKSLYTKFPAGRSIAGTIETVSSITREDILQFHRKHYVPANMIISVVGDTAGIVEMIEEEVERTLGPGSDKQGSDKQGSDKQGSDKHGAQGAPRTGPFPEEPAITSTREETEERVMDQSYVAVGFHAVPKTHGDYYALELTRSIAGKPLSGRLFKEFRIERALAYDVGAHFEAGVNFGFFVLYFSTGKENLEQCLDLALDTLRNTWQVSDRELEESKNYLEGEFLMSRESSHGYAEDISEWEYASRAEDADRFVERIREVSREQIETVVKRYFSNYAMAMILEKETEG